MQLLSYPFRLVGDRAATLTDGSQASLADAVIRLALTRPGDLELVPAYGTPDPLWADPTAGAAQAVSSSIDVAQLNAALATFGPPATIALASVTRQGTTELINLEVTRS